MASKPRRSQTCAATVGALGASSAPNQDRCGWWTRGGWLTKAKAVAGKRAHRLEMEASIIFTELMRDEWTRGLRLEETLADRGRGDGSGAFRALQRVSARLARVDGSAATCYVSRRPSSSLCAGLVMVLDIEVASTDIFERAPPEGRGGPVRASAMVEQRHRGGSRAAEQDVPGNLWQEGKAHPHMRCPCLHICSLCRPLGGYCTRCCTYTCFI